MSQDAGGGRHRLHGRRQTRRLAPGRRALLDRVLPEIEISLGSEADRIDPARLFGSPADELWLEVGFGKGEHLFWHAAENPGVGIIGCEPFINGVAALLARIDSARLTNVRIFIGDAAEVLEALPPDSLTRAFILFPDPWPKKRHHKRRFISDANLSLLADRLRDDGELRFATDHRDYCRWAIQHLERCEELDWTAESPSDWRRRPDDWPSTRYEEKALREGGCCTFLRYRRRKRAATVA